MTTVRSLGLTAESIAKVSCSPLRKVDGRPESQESICLQKFDFHSSQVKRRAVVGVQLF